MGADTDFDHPDGPSTAQPPPTHVPGGVSVHDLLIAHIRERAEFGWRKYGTRLQAFNGRDPLVDALEEVLDAAVYLCQAITERDQKRDLQGGRPYEPKPGEVYGVILRNDPPTAGTHAGL